MDKKSFNLNSTIFKDSDYENIEKDTELILEIFSDFEDLLSEQKPDLDLLEINVSRSNEIIEKVETDVNLVEENTNTNRKYILGCVSTLSCVAIFFCPVGIIPKMIVYGVSAGGFAYSIY